MLNHERVRTFSGCYGSMDVIHGANFLSFSINILARINSGTKPKNKKQTEDDSLKRLKYGKAKYRTPAGF